MVTHYVPVLPLLLNIQNKSKYYLFMQRFSTEFYITDRKSGIRALVNAGTNCKVFPLVIESRLIETTRKCRVLSSHLQSWLRERNLSAEARPLRLEEG